MSALGIVGWPDSGQGVGFQLPPTKILRNEGLLHVARTCMCTECEMTFGSVWLFRCHLRKWHGAHIPNNQPKDASDLLPCPLDHCHASFPELQLFEHFDTFHLDMIMRSCPISSCEYRQAAFCDEGDLYRHLQVAHHLDIDLQLPKPSASMRSTMPQLGHPLNLAFQLANVDMRLMFSPVHAHHNVKVPNHIPKATPNDFSDLDLTHDSPPLFPSFSVSTLSTAPLHTLPPPPPIPTSQFAFLPTPKEQKNFNSLRSIPQFLMAGISVALLNPGRPRIAITGAAKESNTVGSMAAIGCTEPDIEFDGEWAMQQWKRWQHDAGANSPLRDGRITDSMGPDDVEMEIDAILGLMETM